MENLTVNFQLPAAAVFIPLLLDDGHGDYNRSYEQYENNDIDKQIIRPTTAITTIVILKRKNVKRHKKKSSPIF